MLSNHPSIRVNLPPLDQGKWILPVLLFFIWSSPLLSYETKWKDPKFQEKSEEKSVSDGDSEESRPESWFQIDGSLFGGYEFHDRSSSGVIDSAGSEKTGFVLSRVYVHARGGAEKGTFKGWSYQITTDINSDTGSGYDVFLKNLFVDIPLVRNGKTSLRLGQQQTPTVAAQAGVNPVALWGHRYLANAGKGHLHQLGLTTTADRGVGLIHKSDYFGMHLLFANGEGFTAPNAFSVGTSSLDTLAAGTANSYGYYLYGALSFIPTGRNRFVQWNIHLPFIQENITGIDGSEVRRATIDLSNPAAPGFQYYIGEKRAKQDTVYSLESNLILSLPAFSFTIGGGTAVDHDRRSNAYLIDETVLGGIHPADVSTISSHTRIERDRYGMANYVFSHIRWRMLGAVFRYMRGTGGDTLSDHITPRASTPWMAEMINTDATDGVFGNMSLTELQSTQTGQGSFEGLVVGITWHLNARFQVTLGSYTVTGTDTSGRQFQENRFDSITDGAGNSVSSQIESNSALKTSLGIPASESLELNDFIGKKSRIQQTFIRAQYVF